MDRDRIVRIVIAAAAVGMSAFILTTSIALPLTAMIQRAVVLMISLLIIFLKYPLIKKEGSKTGFLDALWALGGLSTGAYVLFNFEAMVARMGAPNTIDLVIGAVCILLVLDATRRSIGWPLPVVTSVFLLYCYFGDYIPGTFGHRGYDAGRIINQMYMTTEGIFGVPLGVVVSIVFLFVLFGSFLEKSGGGNFFINFAVSLAGRARGGPAKIAVIGSGLMGTISGSSIANVATVGTFTIPLMKRVGYRPEFAAAVEAGASTGGQIMPPVMGAGAFIMSEFTQIPYLQIIAAAAIPAVLYYFSIYMNVHFEACRNNMRGLPEDEVPGLKDVLKDGWIYILPIMALVVTLVLGYSPARAAYVGIGLLILAGMLRASTRMKPADFYEALRDAGMTSVGIVAACACAGMIVSAVSMTGLGIKFSNMIGTLAGGKIILALGLTMVASLILGMALPTTANYIVQASVAAPALVALGVPVMTAHLFVFYFGVFADITPPVALAAYTAAGIANSNPLISGFIASRNVIVAFLIPYLFVYFPALLCKAPATEVAFVTATSVLAVIAFSAAFSGYLRRNCNLLERLALLVTGGLLLYPEYLSSVLGLALLVLLYIRQGLGGKGGIAAGT
ncbi:MAG: TRAP transporter permease [Peptococcaceae bacterium]|nr:TRAP transporter permease [Peptococcaceae bacterium]